MKKILLPFVVSGVLLSSSGCTIEHGSKADAIKTVEQNISDDIDGRGSVIDISIPSIKFNSVTAKYDWISNEWTVSGNATYKSLIEGTQYARSFTDYVQTSDNHSWKDIGIQYK